MIYGKGSKDRAEETSYRHEGGKGSEWEELAFLKTSGLKRIDVGGNSILDMLKLRCYLAAYQGQAGSLGIQADRRKVVKPWGCLACLYSQVGDPCSCKQHVPSGEPLPPYILNTDKACRKPGYIV